MFNLCTERTCDPSLFRGRCSGAYAFEEGCPPKLRVLRAFCAEAAAWLSQGRDYAVAVQCTNGFSMRSAIPWWPMGRVVP